MYNISNKERDEYINRICAMTMGKYESKEDVEKRLNEVFDNMEKDGIDYNDKDFKELFRWYDLHKPPKHLIEDCERAIKKVVPDIDDEMLYRAVAFIIRVDEALGGSETYDIYVAYAEGALNHGFFDKENGDFVKKYF